MGLDSWCVLSAAGSVLGNRRTSVAPARLLDSGQAQRRSVGVPGARSSASASRGATSCAKPRPLDRVACGASVAPAGASGVVGREHRADVVPNRRFRGRMAAERPAVPRVPPRARRAQGARHSPGTMLRCWSTLPSCSTRPQQGVQLKCATTVSVLASAAPGPRRVPRCARAPPVELGSSAFHCGGELCRGRGGRGGSAPRPPQR
jgi:hypothetical protein